MPTAARKEPAQSDSEIIISRVLDAPRQRVWEAMTDPAQLDLWWGPDGFRNVTEQIALEPGGIWRHTMIGPDGTEYPNVTKFEEIVAPDHITYVNGGGRRGGKGVSFRATWTLTPGTPGTADKTELTMQSVFDTPAQRDLAVKEYRAIEGGKQTLARLAAHLAQKPAFELVLERIINAPRQRVFDAWATPEQITPWFAPKPYQLIVHSMDFRPAGKFSMAMRAPNGDEHSFTGTYRQIIPPRSLTWTGEFPGDPADNITTTVTFEEIGSQTKVRARQTFRVMTPTVEMATKGARQGWTMTLDQLAAFCAQSG